MKFNETNRNIPVLAINYSLWCLVS